MVQGSGSLNYPRKYKTHCLYCYDEYTVLCFKYSVCLLSL